MSRFRNRNTVTSPEEIDLAIDHERLNAELHDQPLRYHKYAKLENRASAAMETISLRLEHAKARAHIKYSEEMIKAKVKDVEARVLLDPEVMEMQENLVEAKTVHADLKMLVKAFYQRHEALKELCANDRKKLVD